MITSKESFAKIVLVASMCSILYSSKVNLFAQPSGTTDEQKRTFVTLDDLIQDATLLEEYSPLTISGPYKTFEINKNNEITVQQDFSLHSQKFIDDGIQLLFTKGKKQYDSRNFLGTIINALNYLKQSNIQNQELIDYISNFKAIKEHPFNGQLQIIPFKEFKPTLVQTNAKNDLDQLIEQGIIAQSPDYYFLPENLNSQITEELRNAGLLNKDISIKERIFGICTILSNMMEYDINSHIPFIDRPLEETIINKKAVCREIVQYTIQIYNSIINPEKDKMYNIYALPAVFIYAQEDEQYSHTIMLLLDTKNKNIAFFDPSKVILIQQEIRKIQQQITHASPNDRYKLEQRIITIKTQNPPDCSTYFFKSRRNNH